MKKSLRHPPLTDEALQLVAARFRALGEVQRLRLLRALQGGPRNVTDLIRAAGTTQANVSRHLQALTRDGILARRKEGLHVYYSIADPMIFRLCETVCGSLRQRFADQAAAVAPGNRRFAPKTA